MNFMVVLLTTNATVHLVTLKVQLIDLRQLVELKGPPKAVIILMHRMYIEV